MYDLAEPIAARWATRMWCRLVVLAVVTETVVDDSASFMLERHDITPSPSHL